MQLLLCSSVLPSGLLRWTRVHDYNKSYFVIIVNNFNDIWTYTHLKFICDWHYVHTTLCQPTKKRRHLKKRCVCMIGCASHTCMLLTSTLKLYVWWKIYSKTLLCGIKQEISRICVHPDLLHRQTICLCIYTRFWRCSAQLSCPWAHTLGSGGFAVCSQKSHVLWV